MIRSCYRRAQTGVCLIRPAGSLCRSASISTLVWLVVAAASVGPFRTCRAQAPRRGFEQRSQQQAIEAIPFGKLTEDSQAKLWRVVSKPSLYRQLPAAVIESDPDLYLTLIRYPEIVVNMWQVMGVTKVQIKRTGDFSFDSSDGAGTICNVELIYGDRNTHVYYAEGTYEGKLLRNLIRGSCVLVLQSDYASTQDQAVYVTSRLDMFVQLDNIGAEILAKTLHPLVGKSADHNFTESMKFLGQVSQAAEKKTRGLQRLSDKLTSIDNDVRERFLLATTAANERAGTREAGEMTWGDDFQATSVRAAPVVTAGSRLNEARTRDETTPSRKLLQLRR